MLPPFLAWPIDDNLHVHATPLDEPYFLGFA
jgi:hypothetical protein